MLPLVSSIGSNIYLGFWVVGLLFVLWSTRRSRKARIVGFFLLLAIWFLGTRPAAEKILKPLESQYSQPEVKDLSQKGVRQIVVLTGGGYPVSGEILSSALPHGSVYRFLGGLELAAKLGQQSILVFSGSAGRGSQLTTASTMKELSNLITPDRQVSAEAKSESTAEHAVNVKPLLDPGPFVLLTSAYHMPRAMRSFRKAGLNPIAYPVDFLVSGKDYRLSDFLPSVENLWKTNLALREYLALIFYTLKGW